MLQLLATDTFKFLWCSQEEIHALLCEFAEAGHVVLRLKGGDPFVFGRGGEEALHLQQHGIAVHSVPGALSPHMSLRFCCLFRQHLSVQSRSRYLMQCRQKMHQCSSDMMSMSVHNHVEVAISDILRKILCRLHCFHCALIEHV